MSRGNAKVTKNYMDGWTSTGLSEKAAKTLARMSEELHLNKRDTCSLAIEAFAKSPAYKEMAKDLSVLTTLKAKYPEAFKVGKLEL